MASSTWSRASVQPRHDWTLLILVGTVGLTAAVCGIGLIANGLGIPKEELDGTPFGSFLVPGLVLSFIVGGSLLAAAWLLWQRHPRAWLSAGAAGCILLGWIVVEAILIDSGRGLQATILTLAMLIIGLAMRGSAANQRLRGGL